MELNIDLSLSSQRPFYRLEAIMRSLTTPEEKMAEFRRWFAESTENNLTLFELYFIKSHYIQVENYSTEIIGD